MQCVIDYSLWSVMTEIYDSYVFTSMWELTIIKYKRIRLALYDEHYHLYSQTISYHIMP